MEKKVANNFERGRLILLLSFLFLISGCSTAGMVNIYYSGNFNGAIDNCKCPKVSDGSILNHYTFYKNSIAGRQECIYICTGNIFSYNYGHKENRIILEIIDSLGYDLLAPGRNDAGFCNKINLDRTVSLNIADLSDHVNFKKSGIRITVTSLTEPDYSKYSGNVRINSPDISAIKDFADSIKKKSDLLIVISNLESRIEKKIFNEVKNIDVMISNTNSSPEAISFDNRLYLSHGSNAEKMGKLSICKEIGSGNVILENAFIKIDPELFRDDPGLKALTDSLRLRYGIDVKDIDSDY